MHEALYKIYLESDIADDDLNIYVRVSDQKCAR